jgi:hypothetical protein
MNRRITGTRKIGISDEAYQMLKALKKIAKRHLLGDPSVPMILSNAGVT